jgi:hypothetical protein
VFDISGKLETKIGAIRAYASQFVAHQGNQKRLDEIRTEAMYWGSQVGVQAAEPFVCREVIKVESASGLFSL